MSRELRPWSSRCTTPGVAAANVDGGLRGLRRRADAEAAHATRSSAAAASAPSSRGWRSAARRGARRCPSSDVDSAIVWFDAPTATRTRRRRARRCWSWRGEVIAGMRACGLRMDENGVNADAAPFVRSLSSWQEAAQQLDDRPDAGEGADPHLGHRRQPSGVGCAHRHAGGRHVPAGRQLPAAAAHARPVRAVAPAADATASAASWWSTAASTGDARPQARRADPDPGPGALGGDGGRGDERHHPGAAARRRRGGDAGGRRHAHACATRSS